MKNILGLIFVALFAGCATTPGGFAVHTSQTTGSSEMSVLPGWLYDSSIKMGLVKTTPVQSDDVTLLVVLTNSSAISSKDSLVINIDGEIRKFSPADSRNDFTARSSIIEAERQFAIDLPYLRKMLAGKKVMVQVTDRSNQYVESDFAIGGFTTAKDGFKKFVDHIDRLRSSTPVASAK